MRKLFTSESVTEGHPDKLCDYISDSVLDAYFEQDPYSRVACETVAGKNQILVTGEITSKGTVDIEKVVRDVLKEVGYDNNQTDIDYRNCNVILNICEQSPDIALGVDKSLEEKAAHLLYFVTKNHSFYDGNKRIAATMFLYFLDKNDALFSEGKKRIEDATLVALTIMIAESRVEEKEMMVSVVMNCIL